MKVNPVNGERVVVVYAEPDSNLSKKNMLYLKRDFEVIQTYTIERTIEAVVNRHNVEYFILRRGAFSKEDEAFLIQRVDNINPLVTKILLNVSETWREQNKDIIEKYHLEVLEPENEEEHLLLLVNTLLDENQHERRRFNRIQWPLTASIKAGFHDEEEKKNVLSLSGGGAYIKSEEFLPREGDKLLIEINFKDFKFLTDCEVVWLNDRAQRKDLPRGFAIRFVDPTPSSQKIIDSIIRDRLMKTMMFEYYHNV